MAFTMPATPRSATSSGGYNSGGMVTGGSGGTRTRSLRGAGVVIRSNGNPLANAKGMSLPGSATTRTSSTLPRMSARQLQQPIPHATPSFLRPNSAFIQPSMVPVTASQLLNHQVGSFQPHAIPPPPLSSSSASAIAMPSSFLPPSGGSVPPPLPPRTYEMSDKDMDELCKKVTDHALQDGE